MNCHFLVQFQRSTNKALVKWPRLIYNIVTSNTIEDDRSDFFLTKQISKNDLDKNENSSEKNSFKHTILPRFNALTCLISEYKREGVMLSTNCYVMNPTQKCRPATWWQNNGVSDLWLAINNSGFQAPILETGVLWVCLLFISNNFHSS